MKEYSIERKCTIAILGKYGKIDIPKTGDDEPVVILRAQDRLSKGMIEIYKVITSQHGSHLEDGLDQAARICKQTLLV